MSDFAIGDISGYKTVSDNLIRSVPHITRLIALGDIIDRGPESRQLIEFFLNNPKHLCLMGNHEHMFIKTYEEITYKTKSPYYSLIWIFINGGKQTLQSYGITVPDLSITMDDLRNLNSAQKKELLESKVAKHIFSQFHLIPKEHIEFLKSLPLKIETDQAFFSHAPVSNWANTKIFNYQEFDNNDLLLDIGCLWNRSHPKRPRSDKKLVIYGHQNKSDVFIHTSKHPNGQYLSSGSTHLPPHTWGACIDTVKSGYLTGLKLDDLSLHYQEIK